MRDWPANNALVDFSALVGPLAEWLRAWHDGKTPAPYDGFNIGQRELVCAPPADEALAQLLTGEGLAYHRGQGRDVLGVVIGLAVQLGIEQGRRLLYDDQQVGICMLNDIIKHVPGAHPVRELETAVRLIERLGKGSP